MYNDDGTVRTMARLTVPGETDFIGVEAPRELVAEVIDTAIESGRVTDGTAVEGYGCGCSPSSAPRPRLPRFPSPRARAPRTPGGSAGRRPARR